MFVKLKNRDLRKLRTAVQAAFATFCLYTGFRFYQFYLWALDRSDVYVPRPPAVEAHQNKSQATLLRAPSRTARTPRS